jgi:hypothetical protein
VFDLIVNSKQYETAFEIIDNVRRGWLGIKGCHNVDEMKARNVVSSMVVSNSSQILTIVG